jgi:hypothetical protein
LSIDVYLAVVILAITINAGIGHIAVIRVVVPQSFAVRLTKLCLYSWRLISLMVPLARAVPRRS